MLTRREAGLSRPLPRLFEFGVSIALMLSVSGCSMYWGYIPIWRKGGDAQSARVSGQKGTAPASVSAPVTGQPERMAPGAMASSRRPVDPEAAQRALDLFLREQKVLFKKGDFSTEVSVFYSTDSRDELLVFGNNAAFATLTDRTVNTTISARYGIFDRVELNISVPYVVARQEVAIGSARTKVEDDGLGDVRAGIKYQLWYEAGRRPGIIFDVAGKSRLGEPPFLGSGFREAEFGIALIKTVDPVVFFGRFSVSDPVEREGIKPGEEISLVMGMGFSLNDRVSINLQSINEFFLRDKISGVSVPGSGGEIMSFQFSVTSVLNRHFSLEPVVNIGVTDSASDVFLGMNMPVRF